MKEKIVKIQESFDIDDLYNRVFEIETINEQHENHIENLKRINNNQRKATKSIQRERDVPESEREDFLKK